MVFLVRVSEFSLLDSKEGFERAGANSIAIILPTSYEIFWIHV